MIKEQIAKECSRNTNYIDMTLEDREKEILSALTRLEREILSCRNVEAEEWKASSQQYHRCNTALVDKLAIAEEMLNYVEESGDPSRVWEAKERMKRV